MQRSQFNTIIQLLAHLSQEVEAIRSNQKNFATKDDLKQFASKDDLAEMTHTILKTIGEPFAHLESTVHKNHEGRIKKLEQRKHYALFKRS